MSHNDLSTIRVILLTGEEFQRSERLSDIIEATVDPATRDFNFDTFSPEDLKENNAEKKADNKVGKLAEIIIMFPMMAARRVIVIRDFDSLHPETRKKISAIIAGTPDTTLVIVEGEKASLSPKPPSKHLLTESFKRIYESHLPSWVRGRFAKRGKKVSDGAIALLINNIGDGLRELDGEIDKILVTVGDSEMVDEKAVEQVVGAFRRYTVWAFCNAVGLGNFGEAAHILENLMETERNRETWYLSSLASHIMKIAEYNRLVREGTPHEDAIKMVSDNPYFWKLNNMDIQTRNYNDRDIRRTLTAIGRTESTLKKSGIDHRLLMELMLPYMMPKAGKG